MGVSIVFIGAVAAVAYSTVRPLPASGPPASNDASILDRPTLDRLPKQAVSSASLARLSDTITPPTNSWISGMVLQDKPMAVYPMPLSFQATDTGFSIGLPTITSTATTISGGHSAGIDATIKDASSFTLTRFDRTSATITYRSAMTDLGYLTMTQGSPYVFYHAMADTEILVDKAVDVQTKDGAHRFTVNKKEYVLSPHDQTTIRVQDDQIRATVPKGSLLTFYALPAGQEDTLKEFAGNEVNSVAVDIDENADESRTKFTYSTENNQPTIVSFLPYLAIKDGKKIEPAFQSIYGDMNTYQGTTFQTTAPLITASSKLDLDDISKEEKSLLIADLLADSQKVTVEPQDSYFAAKQVARIANLLRIAKQLNQDEVSTRLQSALKKELTNRLGKDYFYYDTELKGIAAKTKAFGSEDFNDHHFHYGYFIYAASILGEYDPSFMSEYKNEVNLLVADIASYETYKEFPVMRNYDPYSAHSWAAGLAPFQDGNNQESSSEAIHAWNAVTLWAKLIGNKTLEDGAQWMLSGETSTASKAWRNVDTSPDYLSSYTSPEASLSFGGKRTYTTFFSDESNAKLGIQLIPMSPVMEVFASDGNAISSKLAAQDNPSDFNVVLGDYLIMYLALKDRSAASSALDRQQDSFIDDGNSRTYLRAWIYAQ